MILVGMQVRSSRSWMAGASWSPTVPARRKHANRGLGGCTWYWPDQDRRAGAQANVSRSTVQRIAPHRVRAFLVTFSLFNLFFFQVREELAGNSSYGAERGLSAGSTWPVLLKK